jgi:hypothetical protein
MPCYSSSMTGCYLYSDEASHLVRLPETCPGSPREVLCRFARVGDGEPESSAGWMRRHLPLPPPSRGGAVKSRVFVACHRYRMPALLQRPSDRAISRALRLDSRPFRILRYWLGPWRNPLFRTYTPLNQSCGWTHRIGGGRQFNRPFSSVRQANRSESPRLLPLML